MPSLIKQPKKGYNSEINSVFYGFLVESVRNALKIY